jgi:hypothetical protein
LLAGIDARTLRARRSISSTTGGVHQHVQLGLGDVDAPGVDGVDRVLGAVDADDLLIA